MALETGKKLGPYEIIAPLGAGGMGEVYRARDTRLERDVAIKVLPAHLAGDPQLKQRFEREARTVSSLNHPHICTLHDIGREGSTDFLVMEYLEGETLAKRLERGPLPAEQLLRAGIEISDALDKAHRKGVVHRDLKPGNIMLTPAGAKVLDFGLAKSAGPVSGMSSSLAGAATAGMSATPTQSSPLTAQGTIVGTFQYMAPEQLEGREADVRSDIFSFGAVLYEMATAKKAFPGKSQYSVASAILERDPEPMSAAQPESPRALERVVSRCLAKDPENRWQTTRDVTIELEMISEGGGVAAGEVAGHRPALQWTAWGAAAVSLIAAVALAVAYFGKPSEVARPIRSSILPAEKVSFATSGTEGGGAVLSPDGARLVVPARDASGKFALWVRPLDSLTAQRLEGTEGARYAFWSADSRYVGFFLQGKLKKIDVAGGPPQSVCDAPSGRGGAWSRNDIIVFASDVYSGLSRVPAAGGTPTPLVPLDKSRHQTSLRWPVFLPDGRHFLYWGGEPGSNVGSESNGIYVASADGKDSKFLFKADSNALYAPPGYLLFIREQTLMAQPFDAGGLKLAGDAFPIAEQVANPESYQLGFFSVSQNGALIYQTGGPSQSQILSLDANGKQLGPIGDPGTLGYIKLSPDGRRLAEWVGDPQTKNADLWLIDLSRGVRTRFTFDPKDEDSPVFSPDGSRIVFSSNRKGPDDLYIKDSSGAGTEQPLLESEDDKFPTDWSSDGRFVTFTQLNNKGKRSADIWMLPLEGDRKPFPFLQTEFNEGSGAFSPDGHWLAYESDESGKVEIYVAPFAPTQAPVTGGSGLQGGKWQVSQGGGRMATWRSDGKALYFLASDEKLMQADATPKGSAIEVGIPRVVFQAPFAPVGPGSRTFDVAANGQRFLIISSKEGAPVPLTLVANWTAGLKK